MTTYRSEPRRLFPVIVLLLVGCGSLHADPGTPASREESLQALSTIGVVGASQSAGFGAGMSLGKVLREGVTAKHRMVSVPDVMFFRAPLRIGDEQVRKVLEQKPTMAIAVDYLFWFAYGQKTDERRHADLKLGMEYLERLNVPLFVGDLPDMRGAAEWMLPKPAVPSKEVLALCNEAIHKWVADNPHIELIPLAEYVAAVRSETPMTVGGQTRAHSMKEVINGDRLHGNKLGQVLLTSLCIDAIHRRYPQLTAEDLILDVDVLRKKVLSPASETPKPDAPDAADDAAPKPDAATPKKQEQPAQGERSKVGGRTQLR